MLKPGQPYEFTIEMYPTSLEFARGHRIRLDISSSNFPVYLDAKHPSQIALPVIPNK